VRRKDRWGTVEDLAGFGPRGAVPRGLGRAYGAAAQNSGGHVLVNLTEGSDESIRLDERTGIVVVDAGVSLEALIATAVPRGWFVPVTPGTRHVTVGGAVASDVHGKNHHVDGSFGSHVQWMDVLLSDGRVVRLSPSEHAAWFWATVGGMGLTGMILRVCLRMLAIESSSMLVETRRSSDLGDLLALMSEGSDDDHRYSVAWVDLLARGRSLGRGVLTRGDHASAADGQQPGHYRSGRTLPGPVWAPNGLLNRRTMGLFNSMWYRKAPRDPSWALESIRAFFHPLDAVTRWNRLYGSHGFIQYQIIVPIEATDALHRIIACFADAQVASFLAVLKRMGPANEAPLSFPEPGWTFTLDCPARARGLADAVTAADRIALEAGGRHYLAKDSHITPSSVRAGYPRLAEWSSVRAEMDPSRTWQSDLSRRLGLV
jgi:decaprenylphospho-beta-D-ribofuranose 2-oxidase